MASRKEQPRGSVAIALQVSPERVDAGTGMVLHARLSCAPACDLTGHKLSVHDGAGAAIGVLELTECHGQADSLGALTLKAPVKPGEHAWSVQSPAVVKKGVSYDETSKAIVFAVTPHATRVLAWDAPSTVVAGDRFTVKVGIKCSSECAFANQVFAIHNHDGKEIAAGTLTDDIWPGTSGLHFAVLELDAPDSAGLYNWSVKCAARDGGTPHAEGAAEFSLRVVAPPECLIRVEAIDKLSETPLAGASVALHPYRAVTDERGIAEIRVAKGAYHLFVANKRYLTLGLPIDVMADMTARAELEAEPDIERN